MKIVKNGRLFGKLNIVDVLILLVVIAAVAFLAVRMVGGSGGETIAADEPSAQANLRYTVLCEDVPLTQAENAVAAVTAEDYECALQEVQFLTVEYDDTSSDSETSYYGYQKYMVTLAAQEGDIYILSRRQLIELIEQNAVVPLDGYIERGVIDPGDRDLGNVTFDEYDDDEQTTGERHVYALQASSLTGMNDALSFNPEGKYMAIVRFSQNPDTAAAVMQEMIELFESPADEAEAQ